jgi:hypothetical protein
VGTDLHNACHKFCGFRTSLISGAVAFAFLSGCATTAFAEDMMRGGDRGSGMRNGVGIGTGIGIGIGIGQGLSQQPAAEPETPRIIKKKTKRTKKEKVAKPLHPKDQPANVEQQSALKFVGKPDSVTHNARQKDGKLGDLSDHKQVTVSKDGSYFTRHYYFAREGEQRSWYYYDVPDTTTAHNKDVPNCKVDDDNCDGPPQGPIYVDNKPFDLPPDVAKLYETPCEGGVLRVGRSYSICAKDKDGNDTWHVRSDDEYACKDGTRKTYRTVDKDTGTPCTEARPGGIGIAMKAEQDHDCNPLQNSEPLRYFESWECIGKSWRVTRYDIKVCTPPDGRQFVGPASTSTPGSPNPNTDAGPCDATDKTARPPTGNPEMKVNAPGAKPL